MRGHLEGLCQAILAHIFRRCCWSVPDTHEMSIMPVRAVRVTDTTLQKHSAFAFLNVRRVAFSTRAKPCKTQCFFYRAHARRTVNYMVGGEPGVNRR